MIARMALNVWSRAEPLDDEEELLCLFSESLGGILLMLVVLLCVRFKLISCPPPLMVLKDSSLPD